ncbi:MAG: hypothetical protein HC828_14335 [Blastochloris sp.]|nr:hypothetical protein [Blastochloris sp.]
MICGSGAATSPPLRYAITSIGFRKRRSSPRQNSGGAARPGVPQYIYSLTEKANDYFPNNYQRLSEALLQEIRRRLPPDGVNVILEGVADQLVTDACIPDLPLDQRLEWVIDYLNNHGYQAHF